MVLVWKGFQILSRSFIRKYRITWQAALNPSSTIFFNTVSTRKIFISLASLPRTKTSELGNIEPDPRVSCGYFDNNPLHHHFVVVIIRSHLHRRYRQRNQNHHHDLIRVWTCTSVSNSQSLPGFSSNKTFSPSDLPANLDQGDEEEGKVVETGIMTMLPCMFFNLFIIWIMKSLNCLLIPIKVMSRRLWWC